MRTTSECPAEATELDTGIHELVSVWTQPSI